MKNFLKILFVLLFGFSVLYGGAIIQFFSAESNSNNIVLMWQSGNEQNVDYYEISRGPDVDNLSIIAKVNSKGSNSGYTYTDQNAYKTSNSFYVYGLVIVDEDGSKSDVIKKSVVHDSISGVKRTWGSIKALFR